MIFGQLFRMDVVVDERYSPHGAASPNDTDSAKQRAFNRRIRSKRQEKEKSKVSEGARTFCDKAETAAMNTMIVAGRRTLYGREQEWF